MSAHACCFLVAALVLVIAALLPRAPALGAGASDPLVVIVAPSLELKNITLPMLRRAFEGNPVEYASGKRFIAFNAPADQPERARFDRVVLGLTPEQMVRFWVDQRIRGLAQPPRTLAPELATRVIASLPGAITYVRESKLTSAVKALTVEGKNPEDEDYLLSR